MSRETSTCFRSRGRKVWSSASSESSLNIRTASSQKRRQDRLGGRNEACDVRLTHTFGRQDGLAFGAEHPSAVPSEALSEQQGHQALRVLVWGLGEQTDEG